MVQARLLARSSPQTIDNISHLNVKPLVVSSVHTVLGHSQKKEISPGAAGCHYTNYTLKSMKGVSCVTQLSCAQSVTNVKNVASNLPVGARLEIFGKLGCRSENSSNPERGLHPPLSDLAKSHKVSHSRKLLCQSPQEQLPDGGITSAYRQKCCRISAQSDLPRVFQPAVFGTQTQQEVETNTRPEQSESFSQCGKIQNGDTGNHQDIPPARGVGHLNRLQGCLLPYPNTGTIQEISEISCPEPDIPIQSTTFGAVHSTLGVHCSSKGGETDGHAQGYKNPPVPRRLVGEGQIPPGSVSSILRT